MKIAIYPGSFNPWHEGHTDVLEKALEIFDHVIVAIGFNPTKTNEPKMKNPELERVLEKYRGRVEATAFNNLLVRFIQDHNENEKPPGVICAIIKGLRNGYDLQYEMDQQTWNEELSEGTLPPTVLFMADKRYAHISSSVIRQLALFNQPQGEQK